MPKGRIPLYRRAVSTEAPKDCPFCGAQPEAVLGKGVRCVTKKCGIYMRLFTIERWNMRAKKAA